MICTRCSYDDRRQSIYKMGQNLCDIDREQIDIGKQPMEQQPPVRTQAHHTNTIQIREVPPINPAHEPKPNFAKPVDYIPQLPLAVTQRVNQLGDFSFPSSNLPSGTYLDQIFHLSNGIFYKGEWKEGSIHGKGKFILQDKSLLEATAIENEVSGVGRYIGRNGDCYQGEFRNNAAHGQGTYKEGNVIYQGQFMNNLPHGEGIQSGESFKFIGQFHHGSKKYGKLVWKDHKGEYSYQGEFKDNLFDGEGELKTGSQLLYGRFQKGRYISKDGR